MTYVLLASSSGWVDAPVVFTVMLVCLVLASVRAWRAVSGAAHSRWMTIVLNSSLVGLLVLYIVLVILRFKTLA
jgi:hypothetical protein